MALSLSVREPEEALDRLAAIRAEIGFVELCVDEMSRPAPESVVRAAGVPVVVSCRPVREGGRFQGSERDRLNLLAAFADAGASYVDVEWDVDSPIPVRRSTRMRVIRSRHLLDEMPRSLLPLYRALRPRGDVVKLAGAARSLADTRPVFELLSAATAPVIGIAMGEAGRITRLLAPAFENALLTFGAASSGESTGPGQMTVGEMIDVYGLHRLHPGAALHIFLHAGSKAPHGLGPGGMPARELHVAVAGEPGEANETVGHLRTLPTVCPIHVVEGDPSRVCSEPHARP